MQHQRIGSDYSELMGTDKVEPWESAEACEPWVMSVWHLETLELRHQRPPRRSLKRTPLVGRGPDLVGRSIAGFQSAVSAVLQLDDLAAVRDWESRAPRVSEISAVVSAIGEAAVEHRPDVQAAIDVLWAEQHETYLRSTHVESVILSGSVRIHKVQIRLAERRAEIGVVHGAPESTLAEHAAAARSWLEQWATIEKVAVAPINSQTRRVLDLVDETRTTSVAEWLDKEDHQL